MQEEQVGGWDSQSRAEFEVPVEPPQEGAKEATGHTSLVLREEDGARNDKILKSSETRQYFS